MAIVTWEGLLEGEELAYLTDIPGSETRAVPLPALHPRLEAALRARGVETLFAHQAEALAAARRGEHIVVATGSDPIVPPIPGLPTLEGVWTNREATGMTAVPRRLLILPGGDHQFKAVRGKYLEEVSAALRWIESGPVK